MCPLGTGYDIFEGCNSVEERFLPQQAAAESYAGTVGEPTTDKKMPGAGWGVSCSGTSNFLFFVKRKLPKKTTQTYGLRIPWRGAGKCEFGGMHSRAGCSGHHCRSKGLCLRSPARRLPRPLAPATVGVFASTGLAIIKSRPLRREAPQWVGVPCGHGV